MSVIIKCVILFICSLILVRLSGKKSLSEMTIATTVVMISVGAVMVGPLVDKGLGNTIAALAIYIGLLWFFEWLELRSSLITKIMTPQPTVVIENGVPYEDRLKKLHMTSGQLNTRLRKAGIGKLSDVEIGIIESNGELSFELIPEARPVTARDLHKMLSEFGLVYSETSKKSADSSASSAVITGNGGMKNLDETTPIESEGEMASRRTMARSSNQTNESQTKRLSPLFRDLP